MEKPIVSVKNVTKKYSLFKKKSDQLLELFAFNKRKKFSALTNISFDVFQGETIGIIGINGSGKSTLSSILAQVTPPTSGDIRIEGETSLVSISAGLNNSLTGLENIELKCLMHGLNKREIEKITPSIIEFADIGDFINQPIKNYSSGMKSRLGFAISVHVQPDILIIDEALSVGDSTFYQKCMEKFDEFKREGKTIFFISHSLSQVQSISDRIIWLNFGQIEMIDNKDIVAKEYTSFVNWFNSLDKYQKKEYRDGMLQTQVDLVAKSDNPSKKTIGRLKRKREKFNKLILFIQFSLIILSFIIATILMFIGNPIIAFKEANEPEIVVTEQPSEEETANPIENIIIDQPGMIIANTAVLYQDMELSNIITELPF
ncbi:ABC transporter ATP-binding protein [Ornithinibacillus sp. 179-J 7C1 HS]|uniref:ABC transporter ATP-binding protein n=1 Tax=Ornithinibacillus sp. 179-J 7C1 HS TaxID=3142384 RepID=UPI0039A11B21